VAVLPNVKKIFIPDRGYTIFDVDLSGADAQVVAWEADDLDLKTLFRSGGNVHVKNAEDNFGPKWAAAKGHHKTPGTERNLIYQDSKKAVHLTNYVGSSRTLATSLGWSIADATAFQRNWFTRHPGIKDWHHRCLQSLRTSYLVRNAFGYHRIYFDRPDNVLSEAVAWIPQSTIAITCFRGALQLERHLPYVEILLQTHDSLTFQLPWRHDEEYEKIRVGLENPIPYPDPLVIKWKITKSRENWGDCEEVK
jgi:DNA polymerase I-like protein with 3'-5' exonuclease and polymerase domains